MNTDTLRETLHAQAGDAPPATGLLDAVRAGSRRRARHRSLLVAATAAAVAAVTVLGGPAVVRSLADPEGPDRFETRLVAELAPEDAPAVGQAVNEFGFDLLGELGSGDENAIISPVSVAAVLAMVLAGAGGDTAAAIADVLHLEDARDVRVGALLRELADADDVTLSVSHGLWLQQGFPFEEDYLAFVQERLDATTAAGDLSAEETVDAIDAWVAAQTEGRIETMAADLDLPDPNAALALLNAVYFLGEWTTAFDPADTADQPFTLADGSTAEVPMMQLSGQELGQTDRDGYRMLRLPYGQGGRYAMEVMLPDQVVDLDTMLGSLDAAEWREAVASLRVDMVDLVGLPRFELTWEAGLNDPLTRLGMGNAFAPGAADFRPMSPMDLFLDIVFHKTYLRVDEQGTEAAAASGAQLSYRCDCASFVVDRPFAFTISDTRTGTILFLGTVADPTG